MIKKAPARVSTLSPISGRLAGDKFGLENAKNFLGNHARHIMSKRIIRHTDGVSVYLAS